MFGRKKKSETKEEVVTDQAGSDQTGSDQAADEAKGTTTRSGQDAGAAAEEQAQAETDAARAGTKTDRSRGPLDASEAPDTAGMIDLGSLRIKPVTGMNLNLEVEQNSQTIVAVALELDGSRVQLQAFAAPKSDVLWPGISSQIDQSVTAQGGRTDRRNGRFGEELLARVPSTGPDGSQGVMIARFVGIDGPRWFLRAVFGGPAAINEEAATALEDLLSAVVVDRGQEPMPPAELLPLRMPEGQQPQPEQEPEPEQDTEQRRGDSDGGPERGPEITQIG